VQVMQKNLIEVEDKEFDNDEIDMYKLINIFSKNIKLFVIAAAHEKLGLIPHEFPHSTLWTVIFWVVLLGLLVWGILVSKRFENK